MTKSIQGFIRKNAGGLGVLFLVSLYYVALAANWTKVISVSSWVLTKVPGALGYLVVMGVFLIAPLTLKSASIERRWWRDSRCMTDCVGSGCLSMAKVAAFVLIPLVLFALGLHFFAGDKFSYPDILARFHLWIFVLTSVVITVLLFGGLSLGADVEVFMDGFKTFPMLSPLLCFSAPSAWGDTLKKLGVVEQNPLLTTLLMSAGFLFLIAFVLVCVAKSLKGDTSAPPRIVDTAGSPIFTPARSKGFFIASLAFTILAFIPTMTAIFELGYSIYSVPKP